MDRISGLPTCVLHDILFFLPSKDAARTCILSKSWNRLVWSSLPVLNFDFDQGKFYGKKLSITKSQEQEEFINMVDHSLQRLQRERVWIHKFRLVITFWDPKVASFIDRWIELVANNYVQELYLLIVTGYHKSIWYNFPNIAIASAGPLKVLHLKSCRLEQNSLFDTENPRPLYLERLHLCDVGLTYNGEEIMHNFISRCPLIEKLHINECWGMKNLRLVNHPKLKEFNVEVRQHKKDPLDILERIEVDVLSLQALHYCGEWNQPHVVHAARCLKSVRISGLSSLKKLAIHFCKLDDLTVIYTPKLSSFTFGAYTIPTKLFSIKAASSTIPWAVSVRLHLYTTDHLNTSWFFELRNFLGQFSKHDLTLSLDIESCRYEFIVEDLREISIPDLPYDVNHLKLQNSESSLSYTTLIDGLLWSCHPRTLSATSDLNSSNDFMKFLCEILIEREEDPACCNSSHVKCWRHYLKDVTIEGIDGTRDDAITNQNNGLVESLLPTLATCKEIVFKLGWVV